MSSAPTPDEIARDARWLAQALDPSAGVARLIAMDRDAYRAASFLDDRMLQAPVDAQLMPWPAVEEAMNGELRTDARWIFHIGHVGSTLVSRLLGEIDGVLAIREPRLLRDLALSPEAVRQRYLAPSIKLLSRTFAPDELACVKATSFVSEIASQLIPGGERALFMYAQPRNYIAGILAGENSVKELEILAPSRVQRIEQRVPRLGQARTHADLAAIGWGCEMTALEAGADAMADRDIEWMDFDRMLETIEEALTRAAAFFGFNASPERVAEIAQGPLMRRYSKAPEFDYTPSLRRDLIAQANRHNRTEIDAALAMLEQAAQESPLLARALERAQPEP
jgi:hypothetical protein